MRPSPSVTSVTAPVLSSRRTCFDGAAAGVSAAPVSRLDSVELLREFLRCRSFPRFRLNSVELLRAFLRCRSFPCGCLEVERVVEGVDLTGRPGLWWPETGRRGWPHGAWLVSMMACYLEFLAAESFSSIAPTGRDVKSCVPRNRGPVEMGAHQGQCSAHSRVSVESMDQCEKFWDHATGHRQDWLTVVGCVPY